jgi:prolyl 4-hydroxylase
LGIKGLLYLKEGGLEMCFRFFWVFILLAIQAIAREGYPLPSHRDLVELSRSPRVYLIEHFLTPLECDYIIYQAGPFLQRSNVVDRSGVQLEVLDNTRTSQGMFFPQFPEDRILDDIQERISAITLFPIGNGEGMQVLHYGPGEEYRPHYDYFDPSTPGGKQCYDRGGQRIATFMIYLHTTEQGGETVFPEANLKIKPIKGNAVLFYNCLPRGKEDPRSLHGGAPVLKGEKWIITKWIRARTFR